jgi:hypothetical protein
MSNNTLTVTIKDAFQPQSYVSIETSF